MSMLEYASMCARMSPRDLADKAAIRETRSKLSRNQFLRILSKDTFTLVERDARITARHGAKRERFFPDWDRRDSLDMIPRHGGSMQPREVSVTSLDQARAF